MSEERKPKAADPTEENVYTDVYRVLLAGMFVSTALFTIGIVLAMRHVEYVPLTTEWVQAHYHARVVLDGLAKLDPASYMLLGTVLLILTPITRVLVSMYVFAMDRDRKFVIVTGVVLGIMAITVVLGFMGLK